MGCTVPAAGGDDVVTLILGLAGEMSYVLGTFRKLEMEGDIAVQKLLAKYGEKLSPFSAAGVRVDDDFNFSGN